MINNNNNNNTLRDKKVASPPSAFPRVLLESLFMIGRFEFLKLSLLTPQDVNNDGFKDIIIGESPEFSSTAGAAYVVFGSEAFYFTNLDVSELNGNNGFRIQGSDVGDYAGTSVAGAGVRSIAGTVPRPGS